MTNDRLTYLEQYSPALVAEIITLALAAAEDEQS